MTRTVTIRTSAEVMPGNSTVVVVDVIRATTTAITAITCGRRCLIAADEREVDDLVRLVDDPLLVGEISGVMPEGFHLNNSPARLAAHGDRSRPVVLLSSTGSPLMKRAGVVGGRAYAAALRNVSAQVRRLEAEGVDVVLMAGFDEEGDPDAGALEKMRVEDELCCGLIARGLIDLGFGADERTRKLTEKWTSAPVDTIRHGRSAAYLARSGQLDDLDFILEHVDDVDGVFAISDIELLARAA